MMAGKRGSMAEQVLVKEIAHWQQRLHQLDDPRTRSQQSMRRFYRELIIYRQQLLAATRDGCPENWADYVADTPS